MTSSSWCSTEYKKKVTDINRNNAVGVIAAAADGLLSLFGMPKALFLCQMFPHVGD